MNPSLRRVGPPTPTTGSDLRVTPPGRPSESVQRVSGATRTSESYGRTDVRTNEELLDPRGYVTYHNAHENHDQDRAPDRVQVPPERLRRRVVGMAPADRAAYLHRLGVEVHTGSRLRRAARRIISAWPLGALGRVERGGRS